MCFWVIEIFYQLCATFKNRTRSQKMIISVCGKNIHVFGDEIISEIIPGITRILEEFKNDKEGLARHTWIITREPLHRDYDKTYVWYTELLKYLQTKSN